MSRFSKSSYTDAMPQDVIDRIVEQWGRERPDLDVSATHVIQRITRLYLLQTASFAAVFARYGLSFGEWEVLAALRRSGPPHRLNPTALYAALVLSSGAMTNRIDRLEKAGLVERLPDPEDRRGTLVSLTRQGMLVCDEAQRDHLANEERLVEGLSAPEREELTHLLRKLLGSPAFQALDPAQTTLGNGGKPTRGLQPAGPGGAGVRKPKPARRSHRRRAGADQLAGVEGLASYLAGALRGYILQPEVDPGASPPGLGRPNVRLAAGETAEPPPPGMDEPDARVGAGEVEEAPPPGLGRPNV